MTVSSEKVGLPARSAEQRIQAPGLPGRNGPNGRAAPGRGRGRPLQMSRAAVLEKIRLLAGREEGLFRVHLAHSGLYARARRMFGSWAAAVEAAGVNYGHTLERARGRSLRTRKARAAKRRAAQAT